jgi:hypothetical protein
MHILIVHDSIIPAFRYGGTERVIWYLRKELANYLRIRCHEYARDCFNAKTMALNYLKKYHKILNNQPLNSTLPKLQKQDDSELLAWK